jgi:hypothetical protein
MRRCLTVLAVLAGLAALPSVASAAGGSIGNPRLSLDGSSVYLDYSVTWDQCTTFGYCGWFASAWEVPASSQCFVDTSYLTWVGSSHDTSGSETASDKFFPHFNPTRICLSVYFDGQEHIIADYVYSKPAPQPVVPTPTPTPPPPVPTPTPQPTVENEQETLPRMSISAAKANVPDVLKDKYKSRFARSTLTRACSRLSAQKVRCRVAWRKRPYRYRGTITMWNDPDDSFYYRWTTSIKRTRISAPK